MGKPFKKELALIPQTIQEINSLDKAELIRSYQKMLTKPLVAIGSGGSTSACHFAEILHQKRGYIAKAITPLEVQTSLDIYRKNNALIISASGRNKDILLAFNSVIEQEPNHIFSLCMRRHSPLGLASNKYSVATTFEYPISSGKDGFLATNSLVSFFLLLSNVYGYNTEGLRLKSEKSYLSAIEKFTRILQAETTFIVLYNAWSKPVAFDIESKFSEAALGTVLLADYRNFGHGRHHWFDKRSKNSVIISLITPDDEVLAKKTLEILPSSVPILELSTHNREAHASIDLLIQSFYLAGRIGEIQGIDPGRPGVPDFGSKLYNLNYLSLYNKKKSKNEQARRIAISRKIYPKRFYELKNDEHLFWTSAYNNYLKKITTTGFGAVVLDYDRTLCSDSRRLEGPESEIIEEIVRITKLGYIVAIITGRGQSVKRDLRTLIVDEMLWNNIIIGYYNGSDIGLLTSEDLPDLNRATEPILTLLNKKIKESKLNEYLCLSLRPSQLTIEMRKDDDWEYLRQGVYQTLMETRENGFLILESSRSIDIIKRPEVSKLNIIKFCEAILKERNLSTCCLCIGDKGNYPGNDFELLSHRYSLSVDEVSQSVDTCWNLSPVSVINSDSCLIYLKSLTPSSNGLSFNYE